jgi:hypothetical protein
MNATQDRLGNGMITNSHEQQPYQFLSKSEHPTLLTNESAHAVRQVKTARQYVITRAGGASISLDRHALSLDIS